MNEQHDFSPQRGFSLIELLIAMFVIAVGLLGIAGLQSYSLTQVKISDKTTYATMDAQHLLDGIRANLPGINNYAISKTSIPSDPGFNCDSTTPGDVQACTPQQLAQYQVYRLYQQIQEEIGDSAQMEITIDPVNATSNMVTLSIYWEVQESKVNPDTKVMETVTKPKKFSFSALL